MLKSTNVTDVLSGETGARRKGRTALVAGGVVVLLAAAAGGWLWWSSGPGLRQPAYETAPASVGDIVVTLVATGTIEPIHTSSIASLQTGRVVAVRVEPNQQVREGDVLAELDTAGFEATLRRAMAVVDAQSSSRSIAELNLADAEAALQRISALAAGTSTSVKDVDLAKSAVQRATAELGGADARLKSAEADLLAALNDVNNATIRAPIDGVVLTATAERGELVGPAAATALFTIASDLTALNLEIEVDEADIDQLAEGNEAVFTVEAMPERPFTGAVTQLRLAPTVRDGVVNYTAVIAVDNADHLLKPGMTATAEITVAQVSGVLTVPNAALRFSLPGSPATEAGDHVHVLDNGSPRVVAVTVGLTDGLRSEITDGELADGDAVITAVEGAH